MGLQTFGPSSSKDEIYKVMYELNALMQWGLNDYKAWFENNIFEWYHKLGGAMNTVSTAVGRAHGLAHLGDFCLVHDAV